MNKNRKLINAFLVSTMMLSGLASTVSAADGTSVERIGGNTRVETAVGVSNHVYKNADTVVLAGYSGEVDALTGTALASSMDAPLLLVSEKSEDVAVIGKEIARLGAKNVVLLGSESVISQKVQDGLVGLGFTVDRVKGDDRFDTAVAVAKKVDSKTGHAFLTYDGRNGVLADALAAGPASGKKNSPILLTSKDKLPAQTKTALTDLNIKEITIVGGKNAVNDVIVEELKAMDIKVDRVAGDNRWETAEEVAKAYFKDSDKVIIANDGYTGSYADALVGGYFGAKHDMPVLLTQVGKLTEPTKNFLGSKAMHAYVLGSKGVVSEAVVDETKVIIDKNIKEDVLAVESVSAINAKEMKITFSQAVKESTVIKNAGTDDTLVTANFTFTTLDGKAIDSNTATGKLSADGKTLTITSVAGEVFEGRYQLVVKDVQNALSEKIVKYDEIVNLGKDTVAPTLATEKVNAATTKVTFSEPISAKGNFTYKLADGTVIPAADITDSALSTDNKSLTLTVNDMTKYAGKTIQVTLLGATDFAGNVITPNPTVFNIVAGNKDGVAPTVSSIKGLSDTKIEINFSEEIQGLVAGDVTITGGSNVNSSIPVATTIKPDATDKKKYVVTFASTILASGQNTALADVKVAKLNTTDLSGEPMANDYTTIVTIKKDTVVPKLVSTKVVKDANGQWLEMKFDKELDPTVGTAVAVNGTSATAFKNYVTTTGTFAFGAGSEFTTDKTGVRVKLANAKFATNPLVDGTKYTFDVDVKGANGVTTTTPVEISFTYNEDASTVKPELQGAVAITNNETLTVKFDRELDGASATNASNYSIAGVQVKSATLGAVDGSGHQSVVLKLGDNTLTGNRNMTISGVKSKAGVAMDSKTVVVSLVENIKPTMLSAKVAGTQKIEVTFSEAITTAGIAGTDDFEIKVGDTVVAYGVTANTLSADGKVVTITLDAALSVTDLDKTITIKSLVGGTSAIEDTSSPANKIKTNTITVAK